MEHQVESIMKATMSNLKDMIDVNTIVGTPIETKFNTVIIPISKVSFTFASGGSDYKVEAINEYTKNQKDETIQYKLPFGGASGAGVCIKPVSFLIVSQDSCKLLPVDYDSSMDKLIDYIPEMLEKGSTVIKCMKDKTKALESMKRKIEENIRKDLEKNKCNDECNCDEIRNEEKFEESKEVVESSKQDLYEKMEE